VVSAHQRGAESARDAALSRGIRSRALGIGIAVAAYAVSFGAVSVATGLSVMQTQALSALMFTGASQFAFVAVIAAGGGAAAAVLTATLLGFRNGLYGLHLARVLSPRGRPGERLSGGRRLGAAMFTIDESTAMAMAYEPDPEPVRRAFWATGWSVFLLWNLGTLLGALGAAAVRDPRMLGLDAAIPAGFLALLWPRLKDRSAWALAIASGAFALVLSPALRPGLPVLVGAGVAVAGALWLTRGPQRVTAVADTAGDSSLPAAGEPAPDLSRSSEAKPARNRSLPAAGEPAPDTSRSSGAKPARGPSRSSDPGPL
jgi:branched chain amino acid efflux pump